MNHFWAAAISCLSRRPSLFQTSHSTFTVIWPLALLFKWKSVPSSVLLSPFPGLSRDPPPAFVHNLEHAPGLFLCLLDMRSDVRGRVGGECWRSCVAVKEGRGGAGCRDECMMQTHIYAGKLAEGARSHRLLLNSRDKRVNVDDFVSVW